MMLRNRKFRIVLFAIVAVVFILAFLRSSSRASEMNILNTSLNNPLINEPKLTESMTEDIRVKKGAKLDIPTDMDGESDHKEAINQEETDQTVVNNSHKEKISKTYPDHAEVADAGSLGKDTLGKDDLKEETLRKDDSIQKPLGEGTLNKDTLMEDTLNKGTLNKDTLNKDTLNKDTLNKDTLNKDTLNKDTLNKDTLNKDTLNKDTLNKDTTVKYTLDKEDNLKAENLATEETALNSNKNPSVIVETNEVSEFDPAKALIEIRSLSPMTIFSKTYCPYSKKIKKLLLEEYEILPAPIVVELDTHEHGSELQSYLAELTGRSTVPNVLVGKSMKSRGGSDDFAKLHKDGTLVKFLQEWGEENIVVQKVEVPSNS